MKAKNMTDEQKELFVDTFYEYFHTDDREVSQPWGCPWLYDAREILEGETIEEMAKQYAEKLNMLDDKNLLY